MLTEYLLNIFTKYWTVKTFSENKFIIDENLKEEIKIYLLLTWQLEISKKGSHIAYVTDSILFWHWAIKTQKRFNSIKATTLVKVIEFTEENFTKLYKEYPWIFDSFIPWTEEELKELDNFFSSISL